MGGSNGYFKCQGVNFASSIPQGYSSNNYIDTKNNKNDAINTCKQTDGCAAVHKTPGGFHLYSLNDDNDTNVLVPDGGKTIFWIDKYPTLPTQIDFANDCDYTSS